MRLHAAIPALPVQDIARSLGFYRDQLGLAVRHQEPGFAIVARDTLEIHLWEANDDAWRTRPGGLGVQSGAESFLAGTASCRIGVTGLDALYHQLQPQGVVHPNAPLMIRPWGDREFGVCDPDGNLLTFVERMEP